MADYYVIDIGNSNIKLSIFHNDQMVSFKSHLQEKDLVEICNGNTSARIIISAVGHDLPHFHNLLLNKNRLLYLTFETAVPIINKYETPHSLGMDRLAAVVGAKGLFPEKDCLVIDIGSCITYDYVDTKSHYLGGLIAPGMHMRLRAMHEFTARLPLVKPNDIPDLIGKSTDSCMASGVINGMAAEINGIIQSFQSTSSDLQVIVCGGDANFFESTIKHTIFACPQLVMLGLKRILSYNENI